MTVLALAKIVLWAIEAYVGGLSARERLEYLKRFGMELNWAHRIGFRMRSRLHEMCESLELDAADYRERPENAGVDDLVTMWKLRRKTLPTRTGRTRCSCHCLFHKQRWNSTVPSCFVKPE